MPCIADVKRSVRAGPAACDGDATSLGDGAGDAVGAGRTGDGDAVPATGVAAAESCGVPDGLDVHEMSRDAIARAAITVIGPAAIPLKPVTVQPPRRAE